MVFHCDPSAIVEDDLLLSMCERMRVLRCRFRSLCIKTSMHGWRWIWRRCGGRQRIGMTERSMTVTAKIYDPRYPLNLEIVLSNDLIFVGSNWDSVFLLIFDKSLIYFKLRVHIRWQTFKNILRSIDLFNMYISPNFNGDFLMAMIGVLRWEQHSAISMRKARILVDDEVEEAGRLMRWWIGKWCT